MNTKRTAAMIGYELKNICGNVFSLLFGVIFPIFMSAIIGNVAMKDIPEAAKTEVHTTLFLSMSLIIPMSIMFISYAANFGQELEAKVPIRLQLYGFTGRQLLTYRLIAYMIFNLFGHIVYSVSAIFILQIHAPKIGVLVLTSVLYLLLGMIFLVIAHAIAYSIQKFGASYGVTMIIYFALMFTSGMMGIRPEQLPEGLAMVARLLPTYHFANDYADFWMGKSYGFAPLIQAYITIGAFAALLFIGAQWYRRRKGVSL